MTLAEMAAALKDRFQYQLEGIGVPTLAQAAARLDALERGEPISQQEGFSGTRATPEELMAEMMPGGGMALSTAKAVKEVPGFRSINRYLTDAERESFEHSNWRKSAKSVVKYANSMARPRELADVAIAGGAKQGWYEDSLEAIGNLFTNRPDDAKRFTALLASLSPQTSVESNLRNALNTWVEWERSGRPQGLRDIQKILSRSTEGADDIEKLLSMEAWWKNAARSLTAPSLGDDFILSGPKVNSFYRNLIGHGDEVTNDTWMGYLMGVPQKVFGGSKDLGLDQYGGITGKGPGYIAANALIRRAADMSNMMPMNVQENTWSWTKALKELAEQPGRVVGNLEASGMPVPEMLQNMTPIESPSGVIDLLTSGALSDEVIGATPAFGDLVRTPEFAGILTGGGYGSRLNALQSYAKQFSSPLDRLEAAGRPYAGDAGVNLRRAARRVRDAKK